MSLPSLPSLPSPLPEVNLATIVGLLLGVLVLAREHRERRAPSATIAWLLVILFVPYLGVPLYLFLGGRKLKRRAAEKRPLYRDAARVTGATPPGPRSLERLLDGMGVPPAAHDAHVKLFVTGEEAFAAFLALLDSAERSLHVATFILGHDEVGAAVVARLIAAAGRGVEVRLLVDAAFFWRADKRALAALRRAGGRVAVFMPLLHVPFRGRSNLRNHRKLAVADGARALVGGMNLAVEYMGPRPLPGRWRDFSLSVDGGAAAELDAVFRDDWEFAAKERLVAPPRVPSSAGAADAGDAVVRVVASGPDVPSDTLYDVLLAALFGAERRVWIATPYFVPDDALTRALILAVRRGLDVRVVVPQRSNHRITDLAGGSYLRALQDAGGVVAPYLPGMLHAKAVVIDDDVAMVGSANFDMRSLFLNYEVALFLYGPREARALTAWFEDVFASCGKRLAPAGKVRSVAEDVARLLSPLV